MQIGSLFRSLFSPFFYADKRQDGQRQASEHGADDGRFAAHKVSLDMRYRDFSFSMSKAKLKGILRRASDGGSLYGDVDGNTIDIDQAAQSSDSEPVNALPYQPGIASLLDRLNRLYGTVKDVANRIHRLEERFLQARNTGSWPGFNPDPAIVVATSLGEEARELFPQEKIAVNGERERAYQTAHPESFLSTRKLDIVA